MDIPDRKPDREVFISFDEFDSLGGPDGMTRHMKELGFRFDSESCPVKLSQPKRVINGPEGSTFQQWDVEPTVIIDMDKKREDLPDLHHDACPKCGSETDIGFGLAGGGFGPYTYCPVCEVVVSKSEEQS